MLFKTAPLKDLHVECPDPLGIGSVSLEQAQRGRVAAGGRLEGLGRDKIPLDPGARDRAYFTGAR